MLHSIIVPVYKVEQYLPKCIDSLLNQDLPASDYEIILVDDGSPDRCGQICDEYADKYANIRVIHQQNGGLSAARNAGIKMARGKYIQFVDSDDYLEPNVLGMLLKRMESDQLDILRFNYQNVDEAGNVFNPDKYSRQFVDYSEEITDGVTFLREKLGTSCYAWQFLLKLELIKMSPMFFEGLYYEDVEWTPRTVLKVHRISSTETAVYDYLSRTGSITSGDSEEIRKLKFDRLVKIIGILNSQMEKTEAKDWYHGMISSIVVGLMNSVATFQPEFRNHSIQTLRDLNVFPLSFFHLNESAKKKARIINISPLIFVCLIRLKNIISK